jgi:iron complex outermembrane receptor protein
MSHLKIRTLPWAVALALPALSLLCGQALAADEKSSTLPVVTVSEAKPSPLGAVVIDAAGVARQLSRSSDSARLLSDIPGLSLFGAGGVSSLPVIHGLADDRLRIKVDGMDLISACGNHMNPPLSYIDPTSVGSIQVFAGLTPVSVGGDSLGGAIVVNSAAPEFAKPGEPTLLKGQAGTFYRSNGGGKGANLSATVATDRFNLTYTGSTVESGNFTAGGDFKPAGPAFKADGKSIYTATQWLAGDEVGSSLYQSTNQSVGLALRHENHQLELKLGVQDISYQGFPNQRMDMTGNASEQLNLRYTGQYGWGTLQARVYDEHTRHQMNFLQDKAYWYAGKAPVAPFFTPAMPAPGMPMDTEGKNTGATVKADVLLSARDTLRVGGEYQRYRFNDWWDASGNGGMSPNTFKSINQGERDRLGVFAEWEAYWNPQWTSQLGVRHETVNMNTGTVQGYNASYALDANAFNAANRASTDHNLDLSALARYTVDSTQTLEFGFARNTRSPNLYERFAWSTGGMAMNMINMVGDGNGYVGNLALRPEIANTLSATLDWHDAEQKNWGLKVTPYFTVVQDYINARRCSSANPNCGAANQTASTGFVFLQYANQDAQLYGLDISGYLPLGKTSDYGSFTATGLLNYVKGKTTNGTEDPLYNMMPLNAKLAVVQRTGAWTHTAEALLVSAKTDVSQIRNEQSTAGYGLLNLRSSYEWKMARLDFGVDNALNRLYDSPLGGAYVGQGTTMPPGVAPYNLAVPGAGRSVNVGVTVKF